ncbi:hypothetical protein [Nonomuraea sp. NPDC049709]
MTLPHSSGAVEGIVDKIKFLRRQMSFRHCVREPAFRDQHGMPVVTV